MISSVRDSTSGVNMLADFTVVIIEFEQYNTILCKLNYVRGLFLKSHRQSQTMEESRQL